MRPADKINELIKNLKLKASAELDKRVHDDISGALAESKRTPSAQPEPKIWRTIMRSPITKLATVAAIIIAVLVGVYQFAGSTDGASVVWGEVLENINSAKTITWKSTSAEEGKSATVRYMVLEPYSMRVEWPDGKIKISDHREERALLLDPANMTATLLYARQEPLNIYDSFLHFRDRPLSVKRISSREINGKQAIGFDVEAPYQLRGNNRHYGVMDNNEPIIQLERVVWVDPETLLPVLIEQTFVGAEGRVVQSSADEIAFDVELDESLFSLEVPGGYELRRDTEMYGRMKSASDMDQILRACVIYDNKHGQWPDSLEALALPGIDVSRYIYLKPPAEQKRSRISRVVLYDAYEVWESGINVGFTNCRVEFIEDESEFQKLLQRK